MRLEMSAPAQTKRIGAVGRGATEEPGKEEYLRRRLYEYRNGPGRTDWFAIGMIDHLLESQHREDLSGVGFLRAGVSKMVLKSTESTEEGCRLGLVLWTSVSEMQCDTTTTTKVGMSEEVEIEPEFVVLGLL
jgi:hypothetical protein